MRKRYVYQSPKLFSTLNIYTYFSSILRATFVTSTRKINENSWRTKAKKLQSWRNISSFHFELKEILGNVGRYMAHVESFWGLLLRIAMFSIFVCFLLLFYLVIRRARKKNIYTYIHLNLRSIYRSQCAWYHMHLIYCNLLNFHWLIVKVYFDNVTF